MRKPFAVICAAFIASATAAEAGSITLDRYRRDQKREESKAFRSLYMDGVREGILAAYAFMPDGAAPFCIPNRFALTGEQAEVIMLQYAKTYNVPGDQLVSLILYMGLKETFPCATGKR